MEKTINLEENIFYAQLSQDKRFLYYGGKSITVYDILLQKKVQQMDKTNASGVFLSHNGKLLACPRYINTSKFEIVFFDVGETLTEKFRVRIPEHSHSSNPVFTMDDRYLLFPGYSGTCRLWRIDCGTGRCEIVYQPQFSNGLIRACHVNNSGILLSIYSTDGNVDRHGILLLDENGGIIKRVSFFPENQIMRIPFRGFLISDTKVLLLYDLRGGRNAAQIVDIGQTSEIHGDFTSNLLQEGIAHAVQVSSNGKYIAWMRIPSIVIVYAIDGFQLIVKEEYPAYVNNIMFTNDGQSLIVCEKVQRIIDLAMKK